MFSFAGGTSSEVPSVGFIVPPVLLPSVQEFERFYQTSHNGRKLTWLFNLATGLFNPYSAVILLRKC